MKNVEGYLNKIIFHNKENNYYILSIFLKCIYTYCACYKIIECYFWYKEILIGDSPYNQVFFSINSILFDTYHWIGWIAKVTSTPKV